MTAHRAALGLAVAFVVGCGGKPEAAAPKQFVPMPKEGPSTAAPADAKPGADQAPPKKLSSPPPPKM